MIADLPPGPWTVTYDEFGGYDMMNSAYTVRDANGRALFAVDCAGIGPDPVAKAVANAAAQGWVKATPEQQDPEVSVPRWALERVMGFADLNDAGPAYAKWQTALMKAAVSEIEHVLDQ